MARKYEDDRLLGLWYYTAQYPRRLSLSMKFFKCMFEMRIKVKWDVFVTRVQTCILILFIQ
jgi:hypothetical protein